MPEARIRTSSDVAGTRSTDIKNILTSARYLVNVTRQEMLGYASAATSNRFRYEQVEKIGDERVLVCHICAPDFYEGRVFGPAHFIATSVDNVPIAHIKKKQHACAHCLY